jgi:predicted AlkP superfamily pyrophosphatase or phosphodiesterase
MTRPLLVWLLLTLLSPLASGQDPTTGDKSRPRKVLIIGIDGCRPDALVAAKAPHLHALVKEGASSLKAQTGPITVSGPGWSSMLTGAWADKHGVRTNDFKGENLKQYPHFFRRLKQARPKSFTASVVHWAPIADHIVVDADINRKHKTDAEVARDAVTVLGRPELDVLFVHFDDVDGAGHGKGFHPTVPEYLAAIEKTDAYVGALLKAMRGRPKSAAEDWLVLVSTDHGGSGKSHGKDNPEHRTIFFIAHGPSVKPGTIEPPPLIVDVATTALMHLGVPPQKSWDLDGKAVGLKVAP